MIILKKCRKCGIIQPIENFSKNKTYADGHTSSCKACDRKYAKEHSKRDRNAVIQANQAEYETLLNNGYVEALYWLGNTLLKLDGYIVNNKGCVYCKWHYDKIGRLKQGKFIAQSSDKDGYAFINIKDNGVNSVYKVHRIVASTFLNKEPHETDVNHIDKNRSNNDKNNLEWLTHTDNMKDVNQNG